MSRQAKISVLGLYEWDNTLFSLMQIPEGLNIDIVTDNILSETAELEVLYPNPEVLKNLIGIWSHKMIGVWTELYKTLLYEYNPIENYNRITEGEKSGSVTSQHSGTDTTADTSRLSGSDTNTGTNTLGGRDTNTGTNTLGGSDTRNNSVTGEEVEKIAGFDSVPSGNNDGLVDSTKKTKTETGAETLAYGKTESISETLAYGKTESSTETMAYGKTDTRNGTFQHGHKIEDENEEETYEHSHGNIGVTTTQKLIREQREVAEYNIYDRIITDFKDRFCILVY